MDYHRGWPHGPSGVAATAGIKENGSRNWKKAMSNSVVITIQRTLLARIMQEP